MCRPIDSNFSDRGAFNNSAVALLASIPQVSSNFAFDLALAPSASNSEEWLDNFHFSVPEISPPNTTSWSVNKAKATSRSKPEENNIGAVYETDENPFKKIHTQVGPDSISIDGCGRYSTVPVPAPTQYAGHTHHFNATLDNRSEMSHIETYHGARKEQGTLFENNFDVTDTDISLLYNILIDTPEEKNTSDCELTGNKEKTELNLLEWQGHVHDSSRSLMALEGTRFSAPSPAATSFPVEEVTHENKNRRLCKHEGSTMAVTRAVKVAIYAFATVEANVVVLKVVEKLLSQNIYAKLMEAVPAVSMMDAIEARKVVDSVDVMEEGSDV
ncbi:hypothetical protein ABG067_000042 [Albugo candida]|uniref:Uncharacterized protein n=1 Tax=Albugo candida TaxID=65357 RepID=A0A024GDT2_9STRA|nr:unnamed protein product [Albugo candida]|eukprot:CCI44849.1 unnamed protein product [Albugo candida]